MKRRREGLSLVEVLVASALLTAVLVPLLYLMMQTIRGTEISLDEIQATNLAAELLEQIQAIPLAVGYDKFPPRPVPNPPPRYPMFVDLAPGGNDCPVLGFSFGRLANRTVPLGELETHGWRRVGNHFCVDASALPDPLVKERSRLFLSPVPEGFARYVQVYIPIVDPDGPTVDPSLSKIVVKVEWKRKFRTGKPVTRRVKVSTLLAAPWR